MNRFIIAISLILSTLKALPAELVELKQPQSPIVVVKLMFHNGSASDPKAKEGLTCLTAETIAQGGTVKMSSSQIKDMIYPWAASYAVNVDKEVTIFTFRFHKDHMEPFYPILRDLILQPRFAEEDFSRVKSNQQNYVDEVIRTSSDEEYSKMALENLLFRNTPYQHMVEGTTDGLKNCGLEDVKKHYRDFFHQSNLTVGIAGGYTPAFLSRMMKDLEQLPKEEVVRILPAIPRMPNQIEVEIVAKDKALGSAIFMGFPMDLNRSNDDFAALMIANSWLGEHRKSYSRLYQKIREQRSMNYGDYTYIEWYKNGGSNMLPKAGVPRQSNYFSVWIRPVQTAKALKAQYAELNSIETGHAHFAIRMAIREMNELIKNGMSQEDFELTRTFLRSYMKLYAQTPEQQLGWLLDSRFYGRKDWLKEADALLATATREQVNEAMKKYWQTTNFYTCIITDRSETVPLSRSLRDNLPSPMSYSTILKDVLSPSILSEDKEVEAYPLKVSKVEIVESNDMFRK